MRREPSMISPFEEMMGRPFFSPFMRRSPTLQELAPAADVYKENDQVVVRAEVPGMKKDQIEVNLTEDTLTLTGEKKEQESREYGLLQDGIVRTVHLPYEVDNGKAEAKYTDGVLEIRIPKSAAAKEKVKKVTI